MSQRIFTLTAIWFAAVIATLFISSNSRAQGPYLSAAGPVHRSMGGASAAAPLDALGALYWNPATISGLENTELEVGMDLLFINHTVASSVGGVSGSTEAEPGVFPIPNMGWVYHTPNPAITLGLAINAVGGFKTNLPADPSNPVLAPAPTGLGRVSSEASFLQIAPVVSLALADNLSVAAGPTVTTGQVGFEPYIFDPANADGSYSTGRSTRYHWGGGIQGGIYYIHDCRWHLGASLKSPSWMEEFQAFGEDQTGAPRLLHTKFDLPLILSLGLAYSGMEDWLIATDVRLVDYANADGFGDPAVFDATGELQGLDYSSIVALAVGVQRRWSERIYLRAGYTFNQNPIKNDEAMFNLASPLIYQHMISLGSSYELTPNIALNAAYSHMLANTRHGPVVLPGVGAVPGSSVSNELDAHFLSFGILIRN